MATVECKACGASVEIKEGAVSGTCPYCDSPVSFSQAAAGDCGLAPMVVCNDEDDKFPATDGNIERLLDKMVEGKTEFVILSEPADGGAFIQSCPDEDEDGVYYVLEYHLREEKIGRNHQTSADSIDEVKDAFKKFRRGDFSFVDDYDWEVVDFD